MPLVVCSRCDRHIRPAEVCPYCQVMTEPRAITEPSWRPVRLAATASLLGIALAACETTSGISLYGGPEEVLPLPEAGPVTPPLFDGAPQDASEAGDDAQDSSNTNDAGDSGGSTDADSGDAADG